MLNAMLLSEPDEDICLRLKPDNHKFVYLCDCGVASGLSHRDGLDLGALFISHAHIDHFNNFDAIMRHQLGAGRAIVITGPVGIAAQVGYRLKSYMWNLTFDDQAVVYEVREVIDAQRYNVYTLRVPEWEPVFDREVINEPLFTTDVFTVHHAILDHGTPSIAYRFQAPGTIKIGAFSQRPGPWIAALKQAYMAQDAERIIDVHGSPQAAGELFDLLFEEPGDSVGFAMDHAATSENHALMGELFDSVKTLFIECYYNDEDIELARINHHSVASASGRVAGLAGVQKPVPCHFSRRYNDRLDEVRGAFHAAYAVALAER